jgi:replicative DNA helicase
MEEYGKIPPQAIELEQAVLGALLIESKSIIRIATWIKPVMFYEDKHQVIFKAIFDLYNNRKNIDLLTVAEKLRQKEELERCGGHFYITQLTTRVASSSHLEEHCQIIYEKFVKREAIRISTNLLNESFNSSDVFDNIHSFTTELLSHTVLEGKCNHISDVTPIAFKQFEQKYLQEIDSSGILTGLQEVDSVLHGFKNSDLIIVAGRPSMGKTALVINFLAHISIRNNIPSLFFSLEMSNLQIVFRLIVCLSGIDSQAVDNPIKYNLTKSEYNKIYGATQEISESPIYIDDKGGINLNYIKTKILQEINEHGIKIVFIDYLQLMTSLKDRGNRNLEIQDITIGLKALAKDVNLPIVLLSQMNRAIENRSKPRPQLSDLRDSGAIEQDADIVIFVHRPERLGITEYSDNTSTNGIAELLIQKHRNGACRDVKVKFTENIMKFNNNEEMPF